VRRDLPLMHAFAPDMAVLEQRIGRICRLGQPRPIPVYYLVSEGGIEARIACMMSLSRQALRSLGIRLRRPKISSTMPPTSMSEPTIAMLSRPVLSTFLLSTAWVGSRGS